MKNYMTSVHLVVAAATRAPQLNENKSSKYVQSDGTRFELNVDFSLSGGTRSIIVVHRIQTTTCWYSKETWSTGWERWDQIGFRSDLFFVIFVDIIFTCCSGSETEFAFFGCCSTLFLVTFGYLFLLLFWLTKKHVVVFYYGWGIKSDRSTSDRIWTSVKFEFLITLQTRCQWLTRSRNKMVWSRLGKWVDQNGGKITTTTTKNNNKKSRKTIRNVQLTGNKLEIPVWDLMKSGGNSRKNRWEAWVYKRNPIVVCFVFVFYLQTITKGCF